MATWQASDILKALGLVASPSDFGATGISIDTRTLKPGEIFVAIKGETCDGHNFIKDAFAKGAVCVVISQPVPELKTESYFLVDDTLEALKAFGSYARLQTEAKVIAITGSVGKTTTKHWLSQVLASFGKTAFSPESYNNCLGVPLSLATLEKDTNFGVFEVGMNNPGEIAPLSTLVQPDIAIITNIAEGHIGHLGSLEKIALEKSEIFKGLKAGGTVVLNQDAPQFDLLKKIATEKGIKNIITVGRAKDADVILLDYKETPSDYASTITAEIKGKKVQYQLSLIGEHYAFTSLFVFACIHHLGLSLEKAIQTLSTLKPFRGRGLQQKVTLLNGNTITLVDDAYNANPTSMKAGLTVLKSLSTKGKKIAVLGEMLELGQNTREYHQNLINEVKDAGIDIVFAAGVGMQSLFEELPDALKGKFEKEAKALVPHLTSAIQDGDIVFVKGSKGSKVSLVVDYLLSQPSTVAA